MKYPRFTRRHERGDLAQALVPVPTHRVKDDPYDAEVARLWLPRGAC
jgi:hypothetical protein